MRRKILVIGAGAAGLMAARLLAEAHHDVTVVEARARAGGRIDTLHSKFSLPVEAGAEFMHGRQPLTLSLLEESKIGITLLSGNRYQLWSGSLQQGEFFDDDWERLTQALHNLKTETDMASFLRQYFGTDEFQKLRQKVRGFVEGYDAADMERVSALALREEWAAADEVHQYHINGGYSGLIRFLEEAARMSGVRFLFSFPVTKIEWSQDRVTVTGTAGGQVEGEKAIITVPLGVLQRGHIAFSPGLPGHADAFSKMGFGNVIKLFFQFTYPFWERSPSRPMKDVAFIFSDAEIPTWWTQRPDPAPLLTGWLAGPEAVKPEHDDESLYRSAIRSLAYIFGCSKSMIRSEIATWSMVNWVKDPYAAGAYAFPTTDSRAATAFIRHPVKNTLYFAGEALYEGHGVGTVEAALASGKEVAGRIVSA